MEPLATNGDINAVQRIESKWLRFWTNTLLNEWKNYSFESFKYGSRLCKDQSSKDLGSQSVFNKRQMSNNFLF